MSDDLQPLTSSYRVGKSRGLGQSAAARGSIYNEALNRVLLQRLPAAELARYRGVMRAVSAGLAQARAGELAAARTTLAGFLEEAGACARRSCWPGRLSRRPWPTWITARVIGCGRVPNSSGRSARMIVSSSSTATT